MHTCNGDLRLRGCLRRQCFEVGEVCSRCSADTHDEWGQVQAEIRNTGALAKLQSTIAERRKSFQRMSNRSKRQPNPMTENQTGLNVAIACSGNGSNNQWRSAARPRSRPT